MNTFIVTVTYSRRLKAGVYLELLFYLFLLLLKIDELFGQQLPMAFYLQKSKNTNINLKKITLIYKNATSLFNFTLHAVARSDLVMDKISFFFFFKLNLIIYCSVLDQT